MTIASAVASTAPVSKQALNHLLGQLEHRGYLRREADRDDRRSKRITITPRGTRAVTVIREAVAEIEDSWARRLGPERFNQLRGILEDLNRP